MNAMKMTRRAAAHDYTQAGIYHITLHVAEEMGQPLGRVVGDGSAPDGSPDAPRIQLSAVGRMVEHELLHSIHDHYPMITVQDYVVMPDHLHFLVEVQDKILSRYGKTLPLGQVIAGFKKGCNKRFWALAAQPAAETAANTGGQTAGHTENQAANTAGHTAAQNGGGTAAQNGGNTAAQNGGHTAAQNGGHTAAQNGGGTAAQNGGGTAAQNGGGTTAQNDGGTAAQNGGGNGGGKAAGHIGARQAGGNTSGVAAGSVQAGFPGAGALPQPYKTPSSATTGRPPLFAYGYCDVMPVDAAQLATQRQYIKDNPRSRLLRSQNRAWLSPRRGTIGTALTIPALRGYLRRECPPSLATDEALSAIEGRLLVAAGGETATLTATKTATHTGGETAALIACDSYGNTGLLTEHRCLPVVCHRKDKALFAQQKARCLDEAARGTVLVSPRIAKGEQEIIDDCVNHGFPVILIADNGFPDRYHPSMARTDLVSAGRLLLVTPWLYQYRGKNEQVTVPFCKTMNCVAQALCRMKDSWWKE